MIWIAAIPAVGMLVVVVIEALLLFRAERS
jgi:hypothetical protein